jgi:F-type H+-transporting ATPase subunit gamma
MKLVSAAKLRRAQESVTKGRAYTEALGGVLAELAGVTAEADVSHPLLEVREVRRSLILVVGGSRGLCGGYNSNVNKKLESQMKSRGAIEVDLVAVGKKPAEFMRRTNKSYIESYEDLSEDATQWPVDKIAERAEELFTSGKVDQVYVLYTKFKSALSMTVTLDKLLPMSGEELLGQTSSDVKEGVISSALTIFEPSADEIFAAVLPRILRSKLRQAFLDAKASEHSSRMTAMEAATKNAGDLAKRLQLTYNKVRQGSITNELLDIIGGAEAIK